MSLALSLSLANFTLARSHLPGQQGLAEQALQAEVAMEVAEHGHSHDAGESREQSDGHWHGHNPADHSHEVPYVALVVFPARVPIPESHAVDAGNGPKTETIGRLERPPRAIFLI
ncbi:MAG: hypothetical protein RLT05_23310 [Bauldia litoralis]